LTSLKTKTTKTIVVIIIAASIGILLGTNTHVRLYGDLVSYLFETKHYEECFILEEWWQKNPFEGTKICPFQNSILEDSSIEKKDKLVNTHDNIILC